MMFLLESTVEDMIYRLMNNEQWRLLEEGYYPNKMLSYVKAKDKLFHNLEEIEVKKKSYIKKLERTISPEHNIKSIELEQKVWRITKPKIPQKQELRRVLYEGNDNEDNMLVLNLEGEFRLLNLEKVIRKYYIIAVKYEIFKAKEGNVGKNIFKNESGLEQIYTHLLDGWLTHLLTGKLEVEEYGNLTQIEVSSELKKLRWPVNYDDGFNIRPRIGKSLSEN